MTYQLDIADQVYDELESTADWYRKTSGYRDVGDKWMSGFVDAIQTLVENPQRFSLAWEAEDLSIELRELNYGSGKRPTHRALFVIEGRVVTVLAIRHHAQQDVTIKDLGLE